MSLLVIGAGGLGCGTLAALMHTPLESGLDAIVVADPDRTDLSNLQRQILYDMEDLDAFKVDGVARLAGRVRPDITVRAMPRRLQGVAEIVDAAQGCRLIIDGSDNFATRFAANDAALALGVPLVHGAAIGFKGQLMSIVPGRTPCLRCLFEGPPDTDREATCRSEGVLGPLVGEVGWLMAMEAMKILRGSGEPLFGRLLTIDAKRQSRRTITLSRRGDCAGCRDLGTG